MDVLKRERTINGSVKIYNILLALDTKEMLEEKGVWLGK